MFMKTVYLFTPLLEIMLLKSPYHTNSERLILWAQKIKLNSCYSGFNIWCNCCWKVADLFGKYFIAYRNYILSFSVSIVLTLICVHIIPEIFSYQITLRLFFISCFLLQILPELLSKGIEHGHVHFHGKVSNNSQMGVIFIGLCIHAIIEGMPMFTFEIEHHHLHEHKHLAFTWVYFTAILIHKLPIAVVLVFF